MCRAQVPEGAPWCPRCHHAPDKAEAELGSLMAEMAEGRDLARKVTLWQPDERHFQPPPDYRWSRVRSSPTSFGFLGRLLFTVLLESPAIILTLISGVPGFWLGMAYVLVSSQLVVKIWHKARV